MARATKLALIVGYIAFSVGIFIIPCILVSNEARSDYFWLRIIWTELLFLLVWGWWTSSFAFVTNLKNSRKDIGAILPSMGLVIALYSAASFVAMLMHAFMPKSAFGDRVHIILQIVLAILLTLLCVFLYLSAAASKAGNNKFKDKKDSPIYLANKLECAEKLIHSQFRNSSEAKHISNLIKQLREKIKFSIQGYGSVTQSKSYSDFADKVRDLLEIVSNIDFDIATSEVITGIDNKINSLIQEVKLITAGLRR